MPEKRKDQVDVCDVTCFDDEKVARLRKDMPDMSMLADLFKVLADDTRTRILYALSREELCVCDLAAVLDSTVSNVSHHLRLLRTSRLVKNRRDGKMVFYSLDDDHVRGLINEGLEHTQHLK